jgi:hypothetical protein
VNAHVGSRGRIEQLIALTEICEAPTEWHVHNKLGTVCSSVKEW